MYQACLRRRDAPDSAAGPLADFPFEGEAGVRPDGVVASQEPLFWQVQAGRAWRLAADRGAPCRYGHP